jgi:hypothetical protein
MNDFDKLINFLDNQRITKLAQANDITRRMDRLREEKAQGPASPMAAEFGLGSEGCLMRLRELDAIASAVRVLGGPDFQSMTPQDVGSFPIWRRRAGQVAAMMGVRQLPVAEYFATSRGLIGQDRTIYGKALKASTDELEFFRALRAEAEKRWALIQETKQAAIDSREQSTRNGDSK